MASNTPQRPRLVTSATHLSAAPAYPSPGLSPDRFASTPALLPSPMANTPPPTRPSISRSRSHSHAPSFSQSLYPSNPLSLAASPLLSPQNSVLNVQQQIPSLRRLLMPTVRPARPPPLLPPRTPKTTKSSPSKLTRARAGSVGPTAHAFPEFLLSPPTSYDWIGGACRFEVVEEQLDIIGYQIYAVEKWVVERRRPVTVLTVYTGDPRHKVTVTALSPLSTLAHPEAQAEWDKAMQQLRRDGARPKEIDQGIIMVTSLANFRSDFTIVPIPGGNYLETREQLYTNINILRMGCSGRGALTLQKPSDTTKDRFTTLYHIPDKAQARSQALFNSTVLELVRLIQAALAIFGMFDLASEERNGLLCDVTWEGIQKWITEIGEPCIGVEPMERVADPTVVSALFSMVLSVRNKLHALGHPVPKDPFLEPLTLLKALACFQPSAKAHSHSYSLSLSYHPSSHSSPQPPSQPLPLSASNSLVGQPPPVIFLTQSLVHAIQIAYDKLKQSESYKVHRVLINKLDDLATDLRTGTTPTNNAESAPRSGAAFNTPTTDLGAFVKAAVLGGSAKDGAPSLRYLWTGRPEEVGRKRKEKDLLSEPEDGDKDGAKDGKEKGTMLEKDVKSSEDEGEFVSGRPWSGRVQRKIESWATLGRGKKLSVDFGSKSRPSLNPESPPPLPVGSSMSLVPAVIVSKEPGDEEEVLSSGQVSPVSDSHPNPPMLGIGDLPIAERSISELSDYDRRMAEFNRKRPLTKTPIGTRIISWSDPVTARGLFDDVEASERKMQHGTGWLGSSPLGKSDSASTTDDHPFALFGDDENEEMGAIRQRRLRGRRSFDDVEKFRGSGSGSGGTMRVSPLARMRIDVELCGQLLVMKRREAHLENVIECLRALASTLSSTNASLRNEFEENQSALTELQARTVVLQQMEGARLKTEGMTQETNALAYESAQFLVDDLWRMAAQPRQKVLDLREKVFGTGRRMRQGVHGAHGQFNRVQWRVDGTEVLVDAWGRTESEAEEEEGLPGGHPVLEEEEEGEIVEHPGLRPTWLLRLFTSWGSRWGPKAPAKGRELLPNGKSAEGSGSSGSSSRERGEREGEKEKAMSSSVEGSFGDARVTLSRRQTREVQ